MLEKALTGHEVPSDRKIIDFADVNVEDVDPSSPRIVFESDEVDTFAICRRVRLFHVNITYGSINKAKILWGTHSRGYLISLMSSGRRNFFIFCIPVRYLNLI